MIKRRNYLVFLDVWVKLWALKKAESRDGGVRGGGNNFSKFICFDKLQWQGC